MAGSSNPEFLQYVDDFYFSVLTDEEEIFPFQDDKYAEELQLQEVIMSTVISSLQKQPRTTATASSNTRAVIHGKGTESSTSFCEICMEGKPNGEMFRNRNCSHVFCTECVRKHIAAKLQENITMVRCPDVKCGGLLDPEFCQPILPPGVFERWDSALRESMILGCQGIHCPYRDCMAFLVDDGGEFGPESECPNCRRMFCAQCKVPWHSGVGCEEFKRLNKDERGREDLMLEELAKRRSWTRCPMCKIYVEKTGGCMHITCRCGFEFCYRCGKKWNNIIHEDCAST